MMNIGRCAALTAFVLIVVGAILLVGCGGGDGGGVVSETGSISGTIVHAATAQPLGDIEVAAGGVTVRTAADGTFTLDNVPAGQQVMQVQADASRGLALPPGVDLTVVVQQGQTTQLGGPVQMIDAVDTPPEPPT